MNGNTAAGDSDPVRLAQRNTVGAALQRVSAKFGSRVALRYNDRAWTYAELDRAANCVARGLLDLGLEPGERVVAFGKNSDAYLLAWFGCARAGLIHVPASFALGATELAYVIEQSEARALFFDEALEAVAHDAATRTGVAVRGTFVDSAEIDVLRLARSATGDANVDLARDDGLAQLLYTSGTTGAPKGAMMSHRALVAEYGSSVMALDFATTDRALAALPLYHCAQMHVFTMPQLLVGAQTRLVQAPEPSLCLRLIEEERITSFFAPPTVWISLLRHDDFERRDLATLERLYYGASIMPVPVLEELRRRLPRARPYNCYGQTEIAPLATVLSPAEHEERPASAGRAVFDVQTRVVDDALRDVAPGERGEIVHRSPHLFDGYWRKEAETAAAFAGGWFHSGDVGYFDDAGYLYIVDRIKDVINTGGVVVASREVEEALFTHPAVSEVAVIALPDPRWIEAVTAIVVARPGVPIDESSLIAHARASLAPFKVPKRIIFAEALPRNSAGKLLKREMRARYGGSADAIAGATLTAERT